MTMNTDANISHVRRFCAVAGSCWLLLGSFTAASASQPPAGSASLSVKESAAPPAAEPLDLDETAKLLTKAAGGKWRTKTTNDVGVTLHGTMPWGGRFHTLCVVFPFRYDETGKAKVLSYADCARPFRVLGSTEQCTVLTDQYEPNPPPKAAAFAAAVSKALKLRPPKVTLEALRRSRQLRKKANINSFALQVWCHGPKDKPYYRLLLTAVPIERKERPFEMIRVLKPRQAEKIIDHLTEEGFLTHAVKMDKKTKKVYKGPACFMTIPMGISRLEGTLAWGPGMLARLGALRKVLDGDSAKAMDKLLNRLAEKHPEWKKPPGKTLSVRQVVRGGYTFIAICEALNEPQAVSATTGAYQKFKVQAFLDGARPAGKTFKLNYQYFANASFPERFVRKGEKVIWIVRKRADSYQGARVLAYTPENHKAVLEAVLVERYAGKAVNGLKLTLRSAKATTVMRLDGRGAEQVPLAFTFDNVGDKPIKIETSDHMWRRLQLHVTGPDGKSVRITELMAERIGPIKVTFSVLKAGQSVTYSRRSGEHFGGKYESHDLLKPGAYRIWASYLSAVAVSNEITLTVKAAPATQPAGVVKRAQGPVAKVTPGFAKIDTFVRGDARIALGRTRAEIRKQLSKGKVKSHKPYAFRKPQPEMFKRDVWVIFYGPEVPGMGRVDELRVSFKGGKVSKLERKVHLCP